MSIGSEITDPDHEGDSSDDNRGNRFEPADEPKTDAGHGPDIKDHPYQLLTPDVVIDAIESTGRSPDARILALNSYENRVYQVGLDGDDPVIAKFYRPDRWSIEQIEEEHQFVQRLFDAEIPVVPPIVIDQKSDIPTLSRFNNFDFCVFPRQGGRAPELDNLDHLHRLGQFIGRIHAIGAGYPFKHRISLRVQAFGYDSAAYLLGNDFIPGDIRSAYESIVNEVLLAIEQNSPESSEFDSISLHGDCHTGNVLWRDDRPHFVDFDDAISGPAIQDLWMLLSGDTANRQRQLAEIVEGYELFREFDLRELKLIEPLRALRVLNYNAWLAKRWHDPAFPMSFPWFNTPRYWSEHILELKELLTSLHERPLTMPDH